VNEIEIARRAIEGRQIGDGTEQLRNLARICGDGEREDDRLRSMPEEKIQDAENSALRQNFHT
jgi:hypothetical protein